MLHPPTVCTLLSGRGSAVKGRHSRPARLPLCVSEARPGVFSANHAVLVSPYYGPHGGEKKLPVRPRRWAPPQSGRTMRDLPPGLPHAEDVIEPFVTLASLIHMISRPHLGVSTLVLTRRNAIIVAKQTTALDLLSQGRLILGVVGHREEEFAFLGADYAHRGAITDKPIVLLQTPWREPRFLPRPEGLAAPRGPGRCPGADDAGGAHSPARAARAVTLGTNAWRISRRSRCAACSRRRITRSGHGWPSRPSVRLFDDQDFACCEGHVVAVGRVA